MKPGQRICIALEEGKALCYAICTPGELCVTAVTDPEYGERPAFAALYELAMDFINKYKGNAAVMNPKADLNLDYKGAEALLTKWQKPEDSILLSISFFHQHTKN